MRTTITLDDELLARAHEMTGVAERSTLIHDGLRLLIQRAAARRLARLGGSAPEFQAPPRRRFPPEPDKPAGTARKAAAVRKPASKSGGGAR